MFRDEGFNYVGFAFKEKKDIIYRTKLEKRIRNITLGEPALIYPQKGEWKNKIMFLHINEIENQEIMKDFIRMYKNNLTLGKALIQRDKEKPFPDHITTESEIYLFDKIKSSYISINDLNYEIAITDLSKTIITGANNICSNIEKIIGKTNFKNNFKKIKENMLLNEKLRIGKKESLREETKKIIEERGTYIPKSRKVVYPQPYC